ncbi:MAG: hypothetical protein HYR94_30400 [Chloroflexi bacterium]|nr:hypothetical protein [Chloroflexota bacterium]
MWQALNNIPMLVDSYSTGVWPHLFAGEYETALQAATETLRLSQSVGNIWHYTATLARMGATYLELGDIGRAANSLEEAIGRAKEADMLVTTHLALPYFILAYLTAGALPQARQLADELYAIRESIFRIRLSDSLGVLVQVKVMQGDLVGAQRLLKEAYQKLDIDNLPIVLVERMLIAEAHLQLALGKPERALERMQVLTGRARRAGVLLYLPEALWLQGKALLMLEQAEQARQSFLEGQKVAAETGARRVWWPILWTLSQLETAAGNTAEAERLRRQAWEIVAYIADHAGSDELRASFLALPEVQSVITGQ